MFEKSCEQKMIFNPNQTTFSSEKQREVWMYGCHITPLSVSLADVHDEETREACTQIYSCIMEILTELYEHAGEYPNTPRWYTGDYLIWMLTGSKPIKHHAAEYSRFLTTLHQYGFVYDEKTEGWFNEKYPLFCEYYPRMAQLFKERKKNLGGYLGRLDFRLFADKIRLTTDDLFFPLSDRDAAFCREMHEYALSKGLKLEMKDPYVFRYIYKKLYALELKNNPFGIFVVYRLDNGKHIPDQLDRLIAVAEEQSDGEVLMEYIKKGICICTGCGGTKKPEVRCGLWTVIGGARLRASVYCHAAIGKMRRGKSDPDFHPEDVEMMKRLLDVRLIQIDRYLNGEST